MCKVSYWYLLLILAGIQLVQGQTLEDLIAAGQLEARVIVETAEPLFQRAPIVIAVEVGTPYRFERGTAVRDFGVGGALVRPVSKFALNETRRRDGERWAFQRLRFRLYAERTGLLELPPLRAVIAVETETQGLVEGTLRLPVPALTIESPPGTEGLNAWVAASKFEVEDTWEGLLKTYQVGDAVTRVRRFTIDGVPAMVIPASPHDEFDGLEVYEAPALVNDKNVGPKLQGIREERVVFTIKQGGRYNIPAQRIHWFNLQSGTIEQIDLAGRTLEVPGAVQGQAAVEAASSTEDRKGWLYPALLVLSAVGGYLLVRSLRRTAGYHRISDQLQLWRDHRRDRRAFMQAAAQGDSRGCLKLIYKRMAHVPEWQLSTACVNDPQLYAISVELMAHAYGRPSAGGASTAALVGAV